MHCSNCGAQYRTRDLACPYCGTENMLGRIWMVQRSEAEKEYEKARAEAGKGLSVYVLNRVVNRILIILSGIILFSVLIVIIAAFVRPVTHALRKNFERDSMEKNMEEYLAAGEYERLFNYMSDMDLLYEDEYDLYAQAARIGIDYSRFRQNRLSFLTEPEEDRERDSYEFVYSVKDGIEVLEEDKGSLADILPENQARYDEMCRDITAYLVGVLGCTDEEMDQILGTDYLYSSEENELLDRIWERGAWRQ